MYNSNGNEEKEQNNSTVEQTNNYNVNFNTQTKSTQSKFGNLFNKKTEETNKKQPNINEEKFPENKNETGINSTSETVPKTTKEEEKLFRPIFTNSSKNNDNDTRKPSIEVEKVVAKKEENIIQYKIINDYFKVIDKVSAKTDSILYDVDYLMKFRNVSSIHNK